MKISTRIIKKCLVIVCFLSSVTRADNVSVPLYIENRAGELSDILPDALFESGGMLLATVTDFIITGTMDARDFRYLSNSKTYFSSLVTLDITGIDMEEVTLDGITYPDYEIPANAFDGFATLRSVILPESVTHIGSKAFAGCSALKTMPNSITHIGGQAFAWARFLGDVVTSNALVELGNEAYAYCDDDNQDLPGLSSIDLPATLTKIGNNVFNNCNKLEHVIIRAVTPPSINGGFGSNLGGKVGESGTRPTLFVPDASVGAYGAIGAYSSAFIIKAISEITAYSTEEMQDQPEAFILQNVLVVNNLTEGDKVSVSDLQGRGLFATIANSSTLTWTTAGLNSFLLVTVSGDNGKQITLKVIK